MGYIHLRGLKPSLSMKIVSINDFTTKLLSKLLSNLYIGVHLKGTKKFGSKVINRQLFHRKTVFHMKKLSITTMVSVSTVQPSINLEFLCTYKNLKMSLDTLF